jgi:hypothetical protein
MSHPDDIMWSHYWSRGVAGRVKLTGKKRSAKLGTAGQRSDRYAREYICEDCNHKGWSRHSDLALKEERENRG